MARSTLAAQDCSTAGLAPTYAAADAAGSAFKNTGRNVLHVKNGSASSINVTIPIPGTVDGMPAPSRVVAVPNGGERFIGPFPPVYTQADGTALVDFSAVLTVTVALLEV